MKITIIVLCMIAYTVFAIPLYPDDADHLDLGRASLDTVWRTVYENHYDTTFGGLDWRKIRSRYIELTVGVADEDSLISLMNKMLLELKLSHYAVLQTDKKERLISPLFAESSIGLDLRLFVNEAVITSLDENFPAAQAGLKPGYAIKNINGVPVQQLLREAMAKHVPHFNERRKINGMCKQVLYRCFGHSGDTVHISYADDSGILHEVSLPMIKRGEGVKIAEHFPTIYVDFRSKRLTDSIGYIKFSAFAPPVDSLFKVALAEMMGVRGLIIDLRGNPGGMHEIGEAIASKLVTDGVLFSTFRYRDSTSQVFLEPDPPVFEGPIAILIDVMNGSASERFSACMQSIGRAKIIGERSQGSVGPSEIKKLPNGASLMYLVAQSLTPDGTILEDHGVIPDIIALLDRAALLRGVDTQIEQAIIYLEGEID